MPVMRKGYRGVPCLQPACPVTTDPDLASSRGDGGGTLMTAPRGGQNPCLKLTCFWIVVTSFKFDAGRTNSKCLLLGHQGLPAPIFSLPSLCKPHPISCTL